MTDAALKFLLTAKNKCLHQAQVNVSRQPVNSDWLRDFWPINFDAGPVSVAINLSQMDLDAPNVVGLTLSNNANLKKYFVILLR